MANALTGDFDVVAQFGIPAANRVLAAMHAVERFPHSISMRVKDAQRPEIGEIRPAVVAAVDSFGEPVSDHDHIGNPNPHPGLAAAIDSVYFALDPVVNFGNPGILDTPIEPSNFQGRAQLQIFAPTIEIPDHSGTNITVNLQMLSRYFPDKNTNPAAEFIRGNLRITAGVHQVAAQSPFARVVDIDIKNATVGISFVPQWSSRPLAAGDLAGIERLIRNAIRTSFVPSQSDVPAKVGFMQFRSLKGSQSAVAVLLNAEGAGGPGNRNSATNIFLEAGDDFAFGVSADFVRAKLNEAVAEIKNNPLPKFATYTAVIHNIAIDFKNGKAVLVITGRATSPSWWRPNFNFTAKQELKIQPSGDSANLVLGSLSIDTSSMLVDTVEWLIHSRIQSAVNSAFSNSGANDTIRSVLSAKTHLGGLLDSLVKPARRKPGTAPPAPAFQFAYTSADISPAGAVLRGTLGIAAWTPAHVEFERISSGSQGPVELGGLVFNNGPDYSALKAWIPGGTVLSYEWKSQSQSLPGLIEENRFVYINPGPGLSPGVAAAVSGMISGYQPLCLTVHGSRLSASGPIVGETVTATACGVNSFPIFEGALSATGFSMLALTQPDENGNVAIVGHTQPKRASADEAAPNLVVHFGDRSSAADVKELTQALNESGRSDAPTAVLVVMKPGDLSSSPYVDGVTYAEDGDGSWATRFGLKVGSQPLTAVVTPNGNVAWQHEGRVEPGQLAAALRKSLAKAGPVAASLHAPALRIGQQPPNFLFEYEPGREVALRKVSGRPVVIVFWRSTSTQSIDLIRDLDVSAERGNGHGPLILAVNDGEPAELARRVAADSKLSAVVVTDPARRISSAYGINTWPTTVGLDEAGAVRAIRVGRLAGDANDESPVQSGTESARKGQ